MGSILVLDDDKSLREVLEVALSEQQHTIFQAASIQDAVSLLQNDIIDLAFVDLRLGRESGLDFLRWLQEQDMSLPVIMITAYADSQSAVSAMKLGAKDYIAKPFDLDELLLLVQRHLEHSRLAEENQWLKNQIDSRFGTIIGESPKMQDVFTMVRRIAPTDIHVLLTGESGTGKELVARAVHEHSRRRDKALMIVNCGGLPDSLVESELFGYRRGAFTGADRAKKGLVEKADQGSFFLDEVGELQLGTQVKLLRCIQDGSFTPLGGTEIVHSNVRFLAATNRDIEADVAQGKFREDLFYRLSGVIITIPPLRERGDDLFLLAEHFLRTFCRQQNKHISGFTRQAREKLKNYHYPGNVRELETIMARAVALETGPYITKSSLIIYEQAHSGQASQREKVLNRELSLDAYLEQEDREILHRALELTGGHKGQAAELVGLSFRQFRYRLSKYAGNDQGSASGS
ncbi:sigma-54-dependent transcriptional regulator [Desulfovermiculus halophilus]|uniref:sigma-54-dependent transcriptional regulator n=1 Tax=Desulfovermiculus halophilus TaxID=339722 RepID=UPI000482937D|nr:sigma-54 dependent transcriptional regulator [Desulfovermiculus halophilus]